MYWLRNPESIQAAIMRTNWYVMVLAGIVVGVIVYACIFWCIIAYSRRRNAHAAQFTGNVPLEITLTLLSLAIVVGLFVNTYAAEVPVDYVSANPQNRIHVTAFRWSWGFDYNGGRIRQAGTPQAPPSLYLPVNRTTRIDLTTADVNHSFWIPAFLFKRDAIPGMTNSFDLTPTRVGTYLSRCAQFCG
ncbi:MAG: cytochrome c oxidase subunit II, partial [Candidatus Eremiobacteraeota bacterium]|nr:cytochrome c oxidase subunit II [Candidatus Eremiobacteraeota bacterium]